MRRLSSMMALLALTAVGCGSCGGGNGGEGVQAGEQPAESELGVVEGVVRLAPGAELPSRPREPTDQRPAPPESCTPPRTADRQPVQMDAERRLSGALVAASEFEAPTEPPRATHELVIEDCRLTPPLIVATRGDRIELRNETDYPFMPIMGSGGLAQALMQGETRILELDQGGVGAIACTFAAACGQTDVVTLYHPFHTVSGEAGRFRLEVPAGEEIEVHAWHPLFEESGETLTVQPGETRRLELVLAPSTPPPAEAEVEGEPDPAEGEGEGEGEVEDEGAGQPEDDSDTLF